MHFFQGRSRYLPLVIAVVFILSSIIGSQVLLEAPTTFPTNSIITIPRGSSASQVAQQLATARIIAHPSILKLALRLSGTSDTIHSGTYLFNTPQNVFTIAYRLATGAYGFPPVRVTFVEGTTVREIAETIADAFPEMRVEDVIAFARSYEGSLFPDTYLFSPSSNIDLIVKTMRDNFNIKIAPLSVSIASSGKSLSDLIIMASLIEKEARSTEVRRVVSGILWNRLELGMPLQVDAVFGYIFNRNTYSPTFADLKVDSPYNTYTHKGLPPGPINNPGLDALEAALYPTVTDYLYYLTDADGVMHYAITYAGHQANQRKYLH